MIRSLGRDLVEGGSHRSCSDISFSWIDHICAPLVILSPISPPPLRYTSTLSTHRLSRFLNQPSLFTPPSAADNDWPARCFFSSRRGPRKAAIVSAISLPPLLRTLSSPCPIILLINYLYSPYLLLLTTISTPSTFRAHVEIVGKQQSWSSFQLWNYSKLVQARRNMSSCVAIQ